GPLPGVWQAAQLSFRKWWAADNSPGLTCLSHVDARPRAVYWVRAQTAPAPTMTTAAITALRTHAARLMTATSAHKGPQTTHGGRAGRTGPSSVECGLGAPDRTVAGRFRAS